MNRRIAAAAVAITAWIGAGLIAASGDAYASPVSSCSTSRGAVIAVDYSHWNGPIVAGCDLSGPATGIALLNNTGFRTTGTQHDGPQFLCRIGNEAYKGGTQYPTPSTEACVRTPPASAYWSYWRAPKGASSWSYSQWGAYAAGSKPAEGEVQLWIFGGTDITGSNGNPVNGFPTCSPASVRSGSATTCTPTGKKAGKGVDHYKPRAKAKSRAKSGGGSGNGGGGTTTAGGSRRAGGTATTSPKASGSGSTTKSAAPSKRSGSASPGARTTGSAADASASPAGNVIQAKPASKKRPSAGSVAPVVTAVGLAAVLAVGAGWAIWRRRRLGAEDG